MENKDKKIEETKGKAMTFLKDLFRFEKYFFLDFLFFIHIVAQVLVFVGYLVGVLATGDVLKILGGIVLYPIVFFGVRFMFEFWSIMFSINKNLSDIKKNLKK